MTRNEDVIERDHLARQLATVTASRDKAVAAARLLREDLADMVNQHGGAETCLSANETAVETLTATAWLDEGEGQQ